MPHVRSVSIGVWLTRGSRHEPPAHEGIAHFVEHMLFKGTATRSAEDIAQQIDSIGGHLDAFTFHTAVHPLAEHLHREADEFDFMRAIEKDGMKAALEERNRRFGGGWWGW